ncbi:MAG: phage major tail tube protein, partial [Fusobacterium sp.]
FTQGKLSVGKPTDSKQEFSVNYMKVEYDGEEVFEVDKTNMIFKVKGTDYLTETRAAMGM